MFETKCEFPQGLTGCVGTVPSLRDSNLFPTLPSTPPPAPCWAKLSRAYGAGFSASKFH